MEEKCKFSGMEEVLVMRVVKADIILGRRNTKATSVIFGDSGVPQPEKVNNKTKDNKEKEEEKYE